MEEKHESQKSIVMSELMTPDMANFRGNIHGGHLMRLLDRTAYACAVRYARKPVVTLSVDQVLFKEPIHVREIVTCYASVNHVGNTSLEIGIKVTAEDPMTGNVRHTNTCYLTFVAINEDGRPTRIPALNLETEAEKRRFKAAEMRRELRKEWQEKHALIKSGKSTKE